MAKPTRMPPPFSVKSSVMGVGLTPYTSWILPWFCVIIRPWTARSALRPVATCSGSTPAMVMPPRRASGALSTEADVKARVASMVF